MRGDGGSCPDECRGRGGVLPRGSLRIEIAEPPGGLEHPVVVGAAARADAEMDRRAREPLAGVLAAQLDLDVLVHDRHAAVAARVALLGSKELVELVRVHRAPLLVGEWVAGASEDRAQLAPGV